MKVAIDISPLTSGHKVRGVGFYLKHLKAALEEQKSDIDFEFFNSTKEINQPDVIHYPYFDPFSSINMFSSSVPTVVTIHDLTPIKFAKHFPVGVKGQLYWQLNRFRAKNVAAIVTDSMSSKTDILKYLGTPEHKIHVVYLAAGEMFVPKDLSNARKIELQKKYNLPEKFVLYVGDVTWNKNLPRLITACQKKNIPLVLVGKAIFQKDYDTSHPWNTDLVKSQELIESGKIVSVLGFVEDEDLVDLYRMATVFAMPSLYEGFGLPVVEAMQVGCPVVTSREGSLAEVGGEAVKHVDAYNTDAIGDGIASVFESPELQAELKIKGLKQAAKFSWDETARQTITVYKQLIPHER